MIHIKELISILPINCRNGELNLLTFDDMEWYIKNCKKPYYEEFLDFKFSTDIHDNKLRESIYNMIISYKLKIGSGYEARLLLKDTKTNTVYGGCTVFERNGFKDLEVAYFILPKYQGNNLGTEMLSKVCSALKNSNIPFEKILLTIRYDNKASLKVADKVGFKYLSEVDGKYKKNIIMYIDRTSINES